MFRKELHWKLMFKIGVHSVLMVMLGAYLNNKIEIKYAELAMALFLITFAFIFLLKKDLRFKPTNFNSVVGGAVAGFLAGIIGTGEAIRGATLAAFDLKKEIFVSTSASIDLLVDLSRTVIYLWNGYLDKKYFWFIPVLLV